MRFTFAEEKEWLELEELVLGEDGKILIEKTHTVPSVKLVLVRQDFIEFRCEPKYIEPQIAPEGAEYYLLSKVDYLDRNKTPLPENFDFASASTFSEIKYYKEYSS